MSSRPLIGALFACTIPGSTCAVGAITQIPYTFANQRSSVGSLATPFCSDTTGTSAARGGSEIERGADRVLRLDAEQHDVVGAEVDLGRRADNRHRERHVLVGALQPQAMGGDRVAVRTACDQHHLVIVLEQARADHAADRARAVHDEAHR